MEFNKEQIVVKKKPDFSNFGKTKKSSVQIENNIEISTSPTSEVETIEARHVQARLLKQDAIRFKRAAEDNGLKLHDGLIEAINLMMNQWGKPPVSNIGATKKIK